MSWIWTFDLGIMDMGLNNSAAKYYQAERNFMEKFTGNIRKQVRLIIFAAALLACSFFGSLCAYAEAEDRDLIVPDADTRYYTDGDISDMPLQVVNYAKNEIYARHGRIFNSTELAGYFGQQPWYSGSLREADFTDKVFNEYERENILLLNDREMALSGGGGYMLDQPGYNYDAVEDYIAARLGTVQAEALLMRLRKIIGIVSLKNSGGEDLDVEENMRIFSESVLGTKAESGAIVDLDEEKLAILDERSKAALEKNDDGSRLVIQLKKGQLYFSVDEPLAENESFDITFSDLRLAIRGTSGIVTIEDKRTSSVILASGQAMIYEENPEAGTAQGTEIRAGERVRITSDGTGRKTFEKETLSEENLPPFLTGCLRQDPDAVPKVLADTGWTGESFGGNNADEVQAAMEQYRAIISQASSYQYEPGGGTTPTGNYRYALVQMQAKDTVPTLLLEQEASNYLYYARVFQYDPVSATVIQPEPSEFMAEGATPTGGIRCSLAMQGDGNGIQSMNWSSGTGQGDMYRVTLNGASLREEPQWSGRIDQVPGELTSAAIEWHDISDMSALGGQTGEISQPAEPDASGGEEPLPEDGDRLVLTGTLNEYSYDDVAAMAGNYPANDYERQLNPAYWLIELDQPQIIEIMSGGGPELISDEASLIWISDPSGLEQYAGQHVTFSIDPSATWWPSDVSLPLGEPRTADVHILN